MLTALAMMLVLSAPDAGVGWLDKEVIRKVMHTNGAGLRACAEAHLQGNTKAMLTFTINESGLPEGVSATQKPPSHNEVLLRCYETELLKLVFPKPKGGRVSVQYPLIYDFSGQ